MCKLFEFSLYGYIEFVNFWFFNWKGFWKELYLNIIKDLKVK